MLAQIPDVEVVGQVSNLGGVLDAFAQLDPEVVIIDAHLPGGIEALKSIKREKPATVVVMLIDVDYPQYRSRFHSAGANKVLDISNELPRLEKLVVKLAGEPWRRPQALPVPYQLKADPATCEIELRAEQPVPAKSGVRPRFALVSASNKEIAAARYLGASYHQVWQGMAWKRVQVLLHRGPPPCYKVLLDGVATGIVAFETEGESFVKMADECEAMYGVRPQPGRFEPVP
jgi:CheY-like chemotaxis protein